MQQARRADLAAHNGLAHTREVRVEASVEPDLQFHSGLLHRLQRHVDLVQAERDRLFAKNVLARYRRLHNQIRMSSCGRADQHRLNFRVADYFLGRRNNLGNAAPRRQCLRGLAIHIGHGHDLRRRQAKGECLRVNLPNASCPNDSEMKFLSAHSAPRTNFCRLLRKQCLVVSLTISFELALMSMTSRHVPAPGGSVEVSPGWNQTLSETKGLVESWDCSTKLKSPVGATETLKVFLDDVNGCASPDDHDQKSDP